MPLYYFHLQLCDNAVRHVINRTVFGLSCFACWFILGIKVVPIKQAEVAKGNLIVSPWNLRKIPLGVYWTSLLAATSRAGPMLWSWDPVPTVPSMLGLSCQSLLLAHSKDSKKLYKYIYTPITIIAWDTGILLRAVTYINTHVHICTRACYPHRCITAFLSIWLLQGDAIKVFPLTMLHWGREEGGFPLG